MQSILVQELGAGNVAAVDQVHALFAANNIDVSDPKSLIAFLQQADLGDIAGQLVGKALGKIEKEVQRAVPLFFATFIPGAGAARALYKGLNWLLANRTELGEVFTRIVDSLGALSSGTPAAFQSQLLAAMNQSVNVVIPLLAAQFGLDKLPKELKRVVEYVPLKVAETLRSKVRGLAQSVGGGAGANATAGKFTPTEHAFTYRTKNYKLVLVEAGTASQLKIVHSSEGNRVHVFAGKDFGVAGSPGRVKFDAVMDAAAALRSAVAGPTRIALRGKLKGPATPAASGVMTNLKALQDTLDAKLADLKVYLQEHGCQYLNAGCFAAGTKLWTPGGYRAIETLAAGDMVYSRDEFDPSGAIEAKVVEEVFVRFAGVYNLHIGGQVIGTSGEHPFYVVGRGWTPACELRPGDRIATADGVGVLVEEVWDTGEWEAVYNLRVSEWHTYFVGDDGWGWACWAHDLCEAIIRRDLNFGPTSVNNRQVFGTAQNTSQSDDPDNAHMQWVNSIVAALTSQAPEGTYFVLNRTWRTALGRDLVPDGTQAAKNRPDIIIVQPTDAERQNWKVHAIEVLSPNQTAAAAIAKLNREWADEVKTTLPNRPGSVQKGDFMGIGINQMPNVSW